MMIPFKSFAIQTEHKHARKCKCLSTIRAWDKRRTTERVSNQALVNSLLLHTCWSTAVMTTAMFNINIFRWRSTGKKKKERRKEKELLRKRDIEREKSVCRKLKMVTKQTARRKCVQRTRESRMWLDACCYFFFFSK